MKSPEQIWQQAVNVINRKIETDVDDSSRDPYEVGRYEGLRSAVIALQESGIDTESEKPCRHYDFNEFCKDCVDALIAEHRGTSPLTSRWQQAKGLVEGLGIDCSSPAFAELFALALEQLETSEERENEQWERGVAHGQMMGRLETLEERRACAALMCGDCETSKPFYDAEAGGWYHAKHYPCDAGKVWDRGGRPILNGTYSRSVTAFRGVSGVTSPGVSPDTVSAVANSLAGNCGETTKRNDPFREGVGCGVGCDDRGRYYYKANGAKVYQSSVAVEVGDYRYGFDEEGAWRYHPSHFAMSNSVLDRSFADPVREAMKERGFAAENVTLMARGNDDLGIVTFYNRHTSSEFTFDTVLRKWVPLAIVGAQLVRAYVLESRATYIPELMAEATRQFNVHRDGYTPLGIPSSAKCGRCGGERDKDRVAICRVCEPDSQ